MNGGHDAGCITRTRRLKDANASHGIRLPQALLGTMSFLWLLPTLTHFYVERALDPLSRPATLESARHNSRPRPARSLKTSGKRDSQAALRPSSDRTMECRDERQPTAHSQRNCDHCRCKD